MDMGEEVVCTSAHNLEPVRTPPSVCLGTRGVMQARSADVGLCAEGGVGG